MIRQVKLLAVFTIAYNFVEGGVSIGFGISDDSIALFGFGVDSFIEVLSAIAVLWRFRLEAAGVSSPLQKERRATIWIGTLFALLGFGTLAATVLRLMNAQHPETTIPGVVISLVSLSFMFYLWRAKLKLGNALRSPTVLSDAACSLACIKLSGVLLAGSFVYWLVPQLWWADSVAALILSVMILREGMEMIQAARKPEFAGGCGCNHC